VTASDSANLKRQGSIEPADATNGASSSAASDTTVVQRIGRLDSAAFGWAAEDDARAIWAHATGYLACGSLLTRDGEIRRRLALLRDDEAASTCSR
jgi:hypothetical protein